MMCVKLTLPIPLRPRKPLMMLRFTSNRRAGTFRKLVAVGTWRLRSMLATMAAPAPRIGSPGSASAVVAAAFGAADAAAAGAAAGGAAVAVAAPVAPVEGPPLLPGR